MLKFILILNFLFCSNLLFPQQYADSVVYALLGGLNSKNTNPNVVLGVPSFPNEGAENDVSLGGGFIIVDMGVYVTNGPGIDLKIYETGHSYPTAADEPFYLLGNENNSMNGWQYLGSYPGDICEIDFDSLNVDNIRFVAIFDKPCNASLMSNYPGADIDALEAVNYHTTTVNAESKRKIVKGFSLLQNYPNPFNPHTTIKYNIFQPSFVTIYIYNSLGIKIKTIVNSYKSAGNYKTVWDGKDEAGKKVTSGNYFYQLKLDDKIVTRQMLLLK